MVGRRTGKRFTIGTPLRVKLLAASEVTGQIDFAPAEGSLPGLGKARARAAAMTTGRPSGNQRFARPSFARQGPRGGQKGKKPPTRKRR